MIIPVILSGGSGSRLWPLSREQHPKQLLALTGEKSLFQQTLQRLEGIAGAKVAHDRPIVVCNSSHRFMIAEQLRQLGIEHAQIMLEPAGRNTAPALTLAALRALEAGEDPVLLVMPADHVVIDRAAFQQAVANAHPVAESGAVVTFGIVPTRPETGYGYLRTGPARGDGALALLEFVEKPDAARAEAYLASGQYLWNSGLFMLRAGVWIEALQALQPQMLSACRAALAGAKVDSDFVRVDAAAFAACPSDSIDYAVMEHLLTQADLGIAAAVLPLDAGWSDVGAWDALWEVMAHDADGNALHGDTLTEGCENSLIFGSDRLVVGVGLKDMIVVETADAVLVADKSRAQDVKQIVARLKQQGRTLAETHRKVLRPWGWYDSIDAGDRFQVKRIVVNPGASLSLQMHYHRAEHWIVVRGTAEVTCGDKVQLLSENQSTYIPLGHVHRLANPGKLPLEMVEVQSGSYLGEDDIVRFEDTYGRAAAEERA